MSPIIINSVLIVSLIIFFILTAMSFTSNDVIAAFPFAPVIVIGSLFASLFLLVNGEPE